MAITLADFNKIWASTSPLTPYSFSESNYKQGWNFIGSTPPARQMWDFLQKNNDEKMQYLANNYLPLSGGTMTGAIVREGNAIVGMPSNTRYVTICGGTDADNGASLALRAKGNNSGFFDLVANDGTNRKVLSGFVNGNLAWGGASLTDGTFLTTRMVQIPTTSTNAYVGSVTAPAVSGYQFLCWVYIVSNGSAFPVYPNTPTNQTTGIYGSNVVADKNVDCHALYIRKWTA